MNSIQFEARAKINLAIDILGKRPNGYHDVRMIMQTVELSDTVNIEIINSSLVVECNLPYIPKAEGNIAYKAAKGLLDKYKISNGLKIYIEKRIPVAAGLAGGSTDAAAVIRCINQLFALGLSDDELMEFGKDIGADVPYCIKGGTMLAEGIGEILTPIPRLPCVDIVLVKPRISVSTQWVYNNLNLEKLHSRPDIEFIIKAICDKKLDVLASNMKNVLESVTIKEYGIIRDIKDKLVYYGAVGSMMSGSGPTVFGLFSSRETAQSAYNEMIKENHECYITHTI